MISASRMHLALWFACLGQAFAGGYLCPVGTPGWPCLRDSSGNPLTIRVTFMDKLFVTTNPAAVQKAASLGITYNCDSPTLAVPECFVADNWNGGWVGAFMNKVFKDMGVNVIAMTKANTSSAAKKLYTGTSSFTRCVWDVLLQHSDMCVGDFWETNERRNLSTFTTAIDSDAFNLFTRLAADPANQFDVANVFMPFDPSVWLLLLIMVFFVSVAFWVVEAPYNEEPEVGFGPQLGPPNLKGLLKACYYSLMAFFGGGLPATRWPSRIVAAGFMFFVFLHITSYIASLASTLVTSNNQLGEIASLQDIITQGKKLCLYQSMAQATSQLIGNAVQTVQMDNYGPMLEKLYQGNCSGAVVGKFESTTFIRASNVNFTVCEAPSDSNNFATCANASQPATTFSLNPSSCGKNCQYTKRFCTFVNTDDPTISLITLAWQLPIRTDLEPWVSAAMMRWHMLGLVTQTQSDQLLDQNPIICPEPSIPSGALTVQQLAGAYVVGGALLVTGLLLHLLGRAVRSFTPQRVTDDQTPSAPTAAAASKQAAEDELARETSMLKAVEEDEASLEERCRGANSRVESLIARVRSLAAASTVRNGAALPKTE